MPKGLPGQLEPSGIAQSSGGLDLGSDLFVLGRVDYHSDRPVVLGRRSNQGRSPDVDLLHHLVRSGTRGDGFAEPIEVHHHEVERRDPMFSQGAHVLRLGPVGEDPGVDPRMKRLHPPLEHFGKARHFRHGRHRDAGLLEHRGGAARRHQGHAVAGKIGHLTVANDADGDAGNFPSLQRLANDFFQFGIRPVHRGTARAEQRERQRAARQRLAPINTCHGGNLVQRKREKARNLERAASLLLSRDIEVRGC